MVSLSLGDVVGPNNPALTTHIALRAFLTTPVSLAFQVFDRTTATPTQVYPASVGTRASVDLETDLVGVGEYVAVWTVPGNAPPGRYEIRWYAVLEDGGAELRWSRAFDVLTAALVNPGRPAYSLVSDVRAEGVPANSVADERIQEALLEAAEVIDNWTGRCFVPTWKEIHLSGIGKRRLILDEPICAIDGVRFHGSDSAIGRDTYRVFARHLTDNLRAPDDRDDPGIEFVLSRVPDPEFMGAIDEPPDTYAFGSRRRFHRGTQNIVIGGVFGYTEHDGSPVGRTPLVVKRASLLLALRQVYPQTSTKAWWAQNEAFVSEKRTREQSIKLGGPANGGGGGTSGPTGDPEIDRRLMAMMPPLRGTGV